MISELLGEDVAGIEQTPGELPEGAPPVETGCGWRTPEQLDIDPARLLLEVSSGGRDTLDYWINRDVQARCRVEGGSTTVGDESFLSDCGRPGIAVEIDGCVLRIAGVAGDDEQLLVAVASSAAEASEAEPMCETRGA